MSGQKCLSIDIGGKNIHVIEGAFRPGFVELFKAFSLETPASSMADGKVEDISGIKDKLRLSFKEKKINSRNVIFTIQSTSIINKDFMLPVMKLDQLPGAASYEMEQYIPTSISQYVVEHKIVGEVIEENIKKWKIRSAAVQKDIVDSYHSLAGELKLVPFALDLHSNSMSKLFKDSMNINGENFNTEKTYAFIDMGHKLTSVHILANKKLEFSRIISEGGRDLDAVIATEFDLIPGKAEEKKKELRLDDEIGPLRPLLHQQLGEVQKILQYYNSRAGGENIQTVFFYGGGSGLKGLTDLTHQLLNVRAVVIEDLSFVKRKNSDVKNIGNYINAAGALIRL